MMTDNEIKLVLVECSQAIHYLSAQVERAREVGYEEDHVVFTELGKRMQYFRFRMEVHAQLLPETKFLIGAIRN